MTSDQWRSVSVAITISWRYTTRLPCLLLYLLSTHFWLSRRTSGLYTTLYWYGGFNSLYMYTYNYILYFSCIQGVPKRGLRFRLSVAFSIPNLWFWQIGNFLWGYLWEQEYLIVSTMVRLCKALSMRNFFGYHRISFQVIWIYCYQYFTVSGVQLKN